MNWSTLKDAVSTCERLERYVKSMHDLALKADKEVAVGETGTTFRLLKALFTILPYDIPEFELYLLPPDIVATAIKEAAKRMKDKANKELISARRLVEEGFIVDEVSNKKNSKYNE